MVEMVMHTKGAGRALVAGSILLSYANYISVYSFRVVLSMLSKQLFLFWFMKSIVNYIILIIRIYREL